LRGTVRRALLDREMTRKEFLQIVGASLIVLLGVGNLLKVLQPKTGQLSETAQKQAMHGFGSRKFGA
jgi:hypothetical protein